jgi:hypothetical protein
LGANSIEVCSASYSFKGELVCAIKAENNASLSTPYFTAVLYIGYQSSATDLEVYHLFRAKMNIFYHFPKISDISPAVGKGVRYGLTGVLNS